MINNNMKSEYDISALKRRGHPLREKVKRGEIKLMNPFDISDEEFNDNKVCKLERGKIKWIMYIMAAPPRD